MKDRHDKRRELGEQEASRRNFLNRVGKASLGIPATVMLMSVTEKQASATGSSMSGGTVTTRTTGLPGSGGDSNGSNCDLLVICDD